MIITLQTLIFFRESLLAALDRFLRPYYKKLSLAFTKNGEVSDDEESDEQVFAEYDDERGVVFYPPLYLQRYAAVTDCLMDEQWCGKLQKVVDLGYHDMSFIKYLKEVQGVKSILGVDLEAIPVHSSMDLMGCEDYEPKKENPLEITLFKGNAADPDYRLVGCDAVIAIEMIEHMLPHDLDRLIHTVFGFIKPWVAIFTTPNGDFNVLFKALEKNGLRRLDHFFEWSRDQFHDWCSNIVTRYPQYTVSCKGIGPGPNGTQHLGCCSQMAVFVAKEYTKQQDLNLNSLALVSESPSPNSVNNLISSWEPSEYPSECHMIEPARSSSYTEIQSEMQSCITIVLSNSSFSHLTIPYQDKASQCDLDTETERSFLMFDYEQMCFDMLKPRRNLERHRVYEFENVYNRLNCTTLEVKTFSKTAQELMSKTKADSLVHTREVVNEIRHLTKMLNFNKELNNQIENGSHIWCNINWGENAPYWNQYYKIVKACNYPFEVKSEECRILDAISDEINRLIDAQFDEDFSFEVNKMEIPLEHLMRVVEHITDDEDKVRDLLEWNGYEVLGDVVIHSRMVVEYSSGGTQEDESQETSDICSDWGSTSMSDRSTTIPDYHARCLYRALDQKVRRLRSMLSVDEDITLEMDQVICRLVKLALQTSRGRKAPPPTRWMQCKLLDLLTLTEKAIERRKIRLSKSCPLKSICYDEESQIMIALAKIKEDTTASDIVDKYKHLVNDSDTEYRYIDIDLDILSESSAEFTKDFEFIDMHPTTVIESEATSDDTKIFQTEDIIPQGESKLKRTRAWVEDDIEVVPYPIHGGIFDSSLVDTEHIASKLNKYYKKSDKRKHSIDLSYFICKKPQSKSQKRKRRDDKSKNNSKTTLTKKRTRKRSSCHIFRFHTTNKKYVTIDYKNYRDNPRKHHKNNICPVIKKPITVGLIELVQQENKLIHDLRICNAKDGSINDNLDKLSHIIETDIAATEQSMFIDIITEDTQETIALRRTIGTEADAGTMVYEDEELIKSVSNTLVTEGGQDNVKNKISTENVHSQTIFLYDLDEPTTSKGIRHTGMDAQCGPDKSAHGYSTLSVTTSLARMPDMFKTGIKIGNSATDTKMMSADFGTCTYDVENYDNKLIPNSNRTVGIKIKDSETDFLVENGDYSIAPTYSVHTANASLTRTHTISSWDVFAGNSKTDNIEKFSHDFGARTNTPEEISNGSFLMEETMIGINTKDSMSNTLKRPDSLSNILDLSHEPSIKRQNYDEKNVFVSTLTYSLNKNFGANTPLDGSISTQDMYDKFILSSQELYQKEAASIAQDARDNLDLNMTSNKIFRSNYPTSTQTKPRSISKEIIKQNKILRSTQKVSANIEVGPVFRTSRPKSANKLHKPLNKSKSSYLKNPKKCSFLAKNSTKQNEIINCLKSNLLPATMTEYSTELGHDSRTVSSSPDRPKLNKQFRVVTDDLTGQISLVRNELVNESKTLQPEVRTCIKSLDNTATVCSVSDTCASIDSHSKTTCVLSYRERSASKYLKRKLSSGGIQIHSYKNQQALSEDIIYQGQWQRNTPKVLTKRKCFNSVASRKNDQIIKKKADAKVMSKIKMLKETASDKPQKVMNKVQRKPLLPFNLHTNLNQTSVKKESKMSEAGEIPKTACVATVAKPFRNILKVPSKFPMSQLPHKNFKPSRDAKNTPSIPICVTKNEETPRRLPKKNYIPAYLRRQKLNSPNRIDETNLNSSIDSAKTNFKENIPKVLVRSKTEDIKRDLLKFQSRPPKPKYLVYRNEVEKKKSDGLQLKTTSDSLKKKDVPRQRLSSPSSGNSSNCSSPCSVATVRAASTRTKHAKCRKHSESFHANDAGNSDSQNSTPERNRKFIKRARTAKITVENKENIPQTSRQGRHIKKDIPKQRDILKLGKPNFIGHKKDIYTAKVEDCSLQICGAASNHKNPKSNVNIPKLVSLSDKKLSPHSSTPLSTKPSIMFDEVSSPTQNDEISECSQTSNMVLVIEPHATFKHITNDYSKKTDEKDVNHCETENCNFVAKENEIVDSTSDENINLTVKELIEARLNFIEDLHDNCEDLRTVILGGEETSASEDLPDSPASFRTVVTSDDNCIDEVLPSYIEYALNITFDDTNVNDSVLNITETPFTSTDLDALSFRSVTSGSKISGYTSADNEFTSSINLPKCTDPTPNSTSVREIFGRKDQPFQPSQNDSAPGFLANQAFSGFTINEDPVAGDQPDSINLIDSETGSVSVTVARQTASEELLISARSSDTFDSCVLDEDAVVPNWLFNIISQQQSALDELESGAELAIPIVEPIFDDNANMIEAPGAGAGAGDGRGIHSDHSQDSSGRGTSISSSESSSGQQSESVLLDPVAFAAQFEMLRDAVENSVVAVGMPEAEIATASRQVAGADQIFGHGESRRVTQHQAVASASDADADISSLETDLEEQQTNDS